MNKIHNNKRTRFLKSGWLKCIAAAVLAVFILAVWQEQKTADLQKKEKMDFCISAFDVGKADAFLITAGSSAVLLDTGEEKDGERILAYLKQKGITKLDCMIITHFDKDHVGGADHILSQILVERIYQTNTKKDSEDYDEYTEILKTLPTQVITPTEIIDFELDGAAFTIYPPGDSYEKKESNNSSLITSITYGNRDFLFMGDSMEERVEEFLELNQREYDFVKIQYHGKKLDLTNSFLKSTKPKYALITSSEEEKENSETVRLLKECGSKILYTRKGMIDLYSDGELLLVIK